MPTVQWDKCYIKAYYDVDRNVYIDFSSDSPPSYGIPLTYTEAEFNRIMASNPSIKWTVLGKKIENNNSKTVEQAFGFKVSEAEVAAHIYKVMEKASPMPVNIDAIQSNIMALGSNIKGEGMIDNAQNVEDVLLAFTRAAFDAMNATGTKDKSVKRAFCNGVGKAISILHPELQEKIKRIANDAKENNLLDTEDHFI